ncbi:hypothetical protein [Stutzerimonas nitrititolerans]|uniref:hypothetical protein n=1 Tax=Stutzerimonas nitrititolerans TaxID=2482751 RepID=UPI0028A68248|nr:hypothetical protein [Stutzerimonas nitrititolerans]
MNKPIHPAVAEHVMQENEKLRGLLRRAKWKLWTSPGDTLRAEIEATLSQQAEPSEPSEPTDTFTATDMATAAAQGFRDGQAAVEPAPAQDEQEVAAVIGFYEGEREPRLLSWNVLPNGEHRLYTRPAQTEQQPVAWLPYLSDGADGVTGHYSIGRKNPAGYREVWNLRRHQWAAFSDGVLLLDEALAILKKLEMPTAPIAQTSPLEDKERAELERYRSGVAKGLLVAVKRQADPQELRIVFDGPPGPEAGRFVEVENADGFSVNAGEWKQRADGLWELVLHSAPQPEQSGLLEALTKCVASLDQLLPYLAKVPADTGLLNDALISARAALSAQGESHE